ncbi:prolyl oligopeptidase family serine peptidase [Pyrococcus sp. ST04]|uniref:prolyl oligopeptidase family serine peptidase n=1 Tax=Pyrococcus sp. ST04 TaxID=1183377 RepID=UPI000260601D|nr:prolyl oligopeptidase family serine peptidase [Pyrococcus sp. ST04]AFK22769.1 prolyl endopeptidase [Pyrococcus sp. ST04]
MHDPYEWMENLNDERVLKLVEDENRRFREFIGKLSEELFPEVWKYFSIPTIYQARITERGIIVALREKDRQVIKWLNGDVIVDSKELEKEVGDEVLLQGFTTDKTGKKLAYSFSIGGADEGITRIIDVDSREILEEIKPSIWNIVFHKDGYYFARFYRKEKTPDGVDPPAERLFWKDKDGERMVFGEGLKSGYFMSLFKSSDEKFAIVTVTYGWNKGEVWLGPIDSPEEWKKIYSAEVPVEPIDFIDGYLYVLTKEGRGLGKIIRVGENGKEEIVPEGEFPLEWAIIVDNKIIAGRLVHASHKIEIYSLEGRKLKEITFKVPGSVYPLHKNDKRAIIRYESFTVPYRIYEITNEELRVIEERVVEGEFRIEEDFATSKDGTKIHYFIVKGEKDEKKAWVFGYGGFNVSLTPRFFPQMIPFLERGGTFVMANLRGGSEYGEEWHKAGMRENKQNVFDDFIAVLSKLKSQGYKVAAWGRSNGGLLVSAVLVQRPDVMDAALIGYPVIDMLKFHKLYIGSVWIPEYGNPDDPKDREFLLKYSPYHNVKPQNYPPTLIYTGLHDDRVHPAHALKFFMKLREVGASVYLRVEMKSGHMGASPETRAREITDLLAFVLKTLS